MFASVAGSTGQARREAFEPLVRLLAVHETAEEMVIYPSIRAQGDDGNRIAGARLTEEDQAKKMLADLEKVDTDSAEFDALFTRFRTAVEAHADSEEREVFPLLERCTDDDQLRRMASALKVAEGIAPTHPHKAAPESALGNMLVGPFVAMVDRARDPSTTRPAERTTATAGDRLSVFVLFSNRLGCAGSLLLSAVVTVALVLLLRLL